MINIIESHAFVPCNTPKIIIKKDEHLTIEQPQKARPKSETYNRLNNIFSRSESLRETETTK